MVAEHRRHGVAERHEVVIDFANHDPGTRIVLRNASVTNDIDFTNTDRCRVRLEGHGGLSR